MVKDIWKNTVLMAGAGTLALGLMSPSATAEVPGIQTLPFSPETTIFTCDLGNGSAEAGSNFFTGTSLILKNAAGDVLLEKRHVGSETTVKSIASIFCASGKTNDLIRLEVKEMNDVVLGERYYCLGQNGHSAYAQSGFDATILVQSDGKHVQGGMSYYEAQKTAENFCRKGPAF